jgi:hypothetical protein
MKDSADFILKLFDKENEDELWQTWLHKEMSVNFADFKKKYYKNANTSKVKSMSAEEEKRIIENATRFIKPKNKGGEN